MNNRTLEHHIQRDIIVRLSMAESLRFSDLKPDGLENNHYTYHLNQLIKDGLIKKSGSGYTLAPAGLTYVDQLSYKNRRPRLQPKIIVILIVKNKQGDYLLARRKVQPYFGYAMLPSGKQHFGEGPAEHAVRELKEKTNLNSRLNLRGYVQVKISHGEQVISHVAAHVFSGQAGTSTTLGQNDERFEFFWQPNDSRGAIKLMPGTREIIDLIESKRTLFFESLDCLLD